MHDQLKLIICLTSKKKKEEEFGDTFLTPCIRERRVCGSFKRWGSRTK
jgi:hypothetical protein